MNHNFIVKAHLDKYAIGERLAKARCDLNLTQQDMASFLGVDKRTIQRYEAGDIKSIPNLHILCVHYKVTPNWILYGCEFSEQFSQEDIALIENYHSFPSPLKHAMYVIFNYLSKRH